jgi:hypothetical protein
MDGWIDGWMNGWMDGWMDEWMDGWMDVHTQREGDMNTQTELQRCGYL